MSIDNPYLNGLAASVAGYIGTITSPATVRDFLAHAAIVDAGLVIYEPGPTFAQNKILVVNAALLNLLNYASFAAYAAAAVAPGFVHADDAEVTQSHIDTGSTAVYDARFLRGNGGYRKCRLQGMRFIEPNANRILRATIVKAAA